MHDRLVFGLGLTSVYLVFFWLHMAFLLAAGRFGWFAKYKIQEDKQPSSAMIREALLTTLAGHSLTVPLAVYYGYDYFSSRGMSFSPEAVPSPSQALLILTLWHMTFDTWFYWTHRLLHSVPWLYRNVHKQHHRFVTPVGIAATFAHPAEDLLVNLPSTFIGPVLIPQAHFLLLAIYLALRLHETVDAHSGYCFPWSPWSWGPLGWLHGGAERHDWHHSHQVGNYGGFFVWDWLCGTDQRWRDWRRRQQHHKS